MINLRKTMIMGELRGGQTTGFIYPRKDTTHKCNLPWILYKPAGTVWRCECGEVYRLTCFVYGKMSRTGVEWRKSTIEEWINAGGTRR